MSVDTKSLESHCQKSIEAFKRELSRIRGGRANASLLEGIQVDYYGTTVPLKQMGTLSVPEARLIAMQVFDQGAVESVAKAIRQAELGLNPSYEGNLIRIIVPALTEERRKDLAKKLHKIAEESKVSIRNHRRESLDQVKEQEKKKILSQDDVRKGTEVIQKVTDKYTAEVDTLLAAKEKEMMEV